jgi:uncharacterized protein
VNLTDEFVVSTPIDTSWSVLTDIERIAPSMPGAELREIDDGEFRGVVKVRLGAITAEYRGAARFVKKDDVAHVAVLRAEGRETRGHGNAVATVTARLEEIEGGTRVTVATDLQITGKVAQFGRGILAEVSSTLLGQFVENLESSVLADTVTDRLPESSDSREKEPSPVGGVEDSGGKRVPDPTSTDEGRPPFGDDRRAAEPLDLIALARGPIARRAARAVASLLAVATVVAIIRRVLRSRRSAPEEKA